VQIDWSENKGFMIEPITGVQRFACTQCGACCNRSPEMELSEAAALADVFVFRLMFRLYELPRTFAAYLASGKTGSSEIFYQKKRLLSAFAAHKYSTKRKHGGKLAESDRYLVLSALTLDSGSGTCSALSDKRCGIYDRRPLACRSVPFHYSRAEASADSDLRAFVETPGYRCQTGDSAPIVLDAGRIVDAGFHQARADALALAEREQRWQRAIAHRVKTATNGLPSLRQIEADAPLGATTISMRHAWQIAADLGVIGAEECRSLIAAQAGTIDQALAATRSPDARETLTEMRAEYQELLSDR
jgi:Fe-S-cluster containining protein